MSIKELREAHGLSQVKCAEYLNIPIRTYKRYEAYEEKVNKIKYQYIIDKLHELDFIDETHGKLSIDQIKSIVNDVLSNYNVDFCYLFGSYAKGKETEKSDIDLLISMPLNGLQCYEILELLRERLNKKVDLLDITELNNNPVLLKEILKDGIKIYG